MARPHRFIGRLSRGLFALWSDRRGALGVNFALAMPVIAVAIGASVDYANLAKQKTVLQQAVDAAALGSARELRLGATNASIIDATARSIVGAVLGGTQSAPSATVGTSILNGGGAVQVNARMTVSTMVGQFLTSAPIVAHASATARMMGGAPICVISLDYSASTALALEKNARLTGAGCSIYSNSNKANSIQTKDTALVSAALICSSGGTVGGTNGFTPPPTLDCPQIPDPLASRPMPAVGACTQTNLVITMGMQTLSPGVYCGGLRITGGAVVTLNPGEYIIKDGALQVDNNSTLNGANVGFFLTGTNAQLNFDSGANTINLTAPVTGSLAGLLVAEDRANAAGQKHQILSDNARTLLGTIYLSRGYLYVASNAPVADQSAYTIIVADTLQLSAGPNLVLNSNYGSTNIPVPAGVGIGSAVLQQ